MIYNIKKFHLVSICLLLTALIFHVNSIYSKADFNITKDYMKYLTKYVPPFIEEVRYSPENPTPDDEIEIRARIMKFKGTREEESVPVSEAILYYSTDTWKTEEEVDMEESDQENIWTATIPALEQQGEIAYRIKALDEENNVSMELPLPVNEEKTEGDETKENDKSLYTSYTLTEVTKDEDDPDREIPPLLDILSLQFGYSERYYYFRITYEATPDQGTITPINANAYVLALLNTRPVPSLEIVRYAWAWFYAPLAEFAPPLPEIGKIPGVSLFHVKPENLRKPIFETQGFDYKIDGNILNLRIDRNFLSETPSDTLLFVTANGSLFGSDFSNVKFRMGDFSPTVLVYMRDHRISVE